MTSSFATFTDFTTKKRRLSLKVAAREHLLRSALLRRGRAAAYAQVRERVSAFYAPWICINSTKNSVSNISLKKPELYL